jgi:hypothetical protein
MQRAVLVVVVALVLLWFGVGGERGDAEDEPGRVMGRR